MSLRPAEVAPVPADTVQVAKAAFPKGCAAMRMRNELGAIYDDQMFASAYPVQGQTAHPPWRLALVTVLQFAEGVSDRQTANAVRGRIDWKHALGLELADPGFDHSTLCEFRTRLIAGGVEQLLLDAMLTRFRELGLLKARGGPTHGQHPRAGRGAGGEPAGKRGRDAACGLERPRCGRARLADAARRR